VHEALKDLHFLAGIFHSSQADLRVGTLDRAVEWREAALQGNSSTRYFCPIWQSLGKEPAWWMTFNQETYSSDLLRLMGGENCFATRRRRYPLSADLEQVEPQDPEGRDTRYPRVTQSEILEVQPEVILLPSEPFAYDASQKERLLEIFAETPAVRHNRVHLVDGSLITWHGTRLGKALQALPDIFGG
jgi:ABC-type Fe3+-hydroxamate transport system substrate-binding protein